MEQEDQSLLEQESCLDKAFFWPKPTNKATAQWSAAPPSTKETKSGVKQPKMNVPTFNNNTLNWNTFSQQFNLAIHSKAQLDDTEKLAYLRDMLKDGPARQATES